MLPFACTREPGREILQVAREGGADVGVDDGRPDTLVFLDLRQHVARERDVGARQAPRDRAPGELLVPRIPIRVQIAHRDRFDPRLHQRRQARLERASVQRRRDRAVEAKTLAHAEPAHTRHQRHGRRHPQIVAIVLETLAHLDDVAVALGRQETDLGSLALEQRVGGDGGAVDDRFGLGEEPAQIRRQLCGQQRQAIDQADGRIRRRRGALGDRERALRVDRDQVGERAADVDADPVRSTQ